MGFSWFKGSARDDCFGNLWAFFGHSHVLSIDSASWLQIPRCCLTLHRVLGKAASPMSCAALAHAGHFPVLVEPWPRSDRGQGRSKSH